LLESVNYNITDKDKEGKGFFKRNNIYVYKSNIIKLLIEKQKKLVFFCIYKVVRKINLSDGKEHAYID